MRANRFDRASERFAPLLDGFRDRRSVGFYRIMCEIRWNQTRDNYRNRVRFGGGNSTACSKTER